MTIFFYNYVVFFALLAISQKYKDGIECLMVIARLGSSWLIISSFCLFAIASTILVAAYSGVKPAAVETSITETNI